MMGVFHFAAAPCVAATLAFSVFGSLSTPAKADNPIVQTNYTADPAPAVYDGTLYLYTTHDEDVTVNDFFTMNDWRVYSTTDAVNWTDHGSPLHYEDFSWAGGSAWAGQTATRNDKYYFYVPVVRGNGGNAIGVGVSDSPIGPFEDALGEPLITSDCGDIDPSVFVDSDGQAYLYWGNPNLCYVLLNEDMISYRGEVVRVPMTTGGLGVRSNNERPVAYEEGPWFYRRDDLYYLVFPGGPLPEHLAYSTSSSPTGPWSYRGVIMPAEGASFTNHPGVIDYKGKSLLFYHNGALPGGGGFKRSVSVEEFTYGADGSIPELRMTTAGATAVDVLNPFAQVEAETIAWQSGIETESCSEGGMNVTSIEGGDFIKVKEVDFGSGATSVDVRIAAPEAGTLELRLDGENGTLVGTCDVVGTGGDQSWATQTCSVDGATGKHDLFLMFRQGGFKFNWWRFSGPGAPDPEGQLGAGGSGGVESDGGNATGGSATGGSATGAAATGGSAPALGAGGSLGVGGGGSGGLVATTGSPAPAGNGAAPGAPGSPSGAPIAAAADSNVPTAPPNAPVAPAAVAPSVQAVGAASRGTTALAPGAPSAANEGAPPGAGTDPAGAQTGCGLRALGGRQHFGAFVTLLLAAGVRLASGHRGRTRPRGSQADEGGQCGPP